MGLRINTNVLALQAQNNLQKTTNKLAQSLQRLSSGLRINTGKDDVVGLLKSESLRSQIRGITAVELNLANASNLLGVAEGSLAQLTDIAQRMREQVLQAADESISTADRTNLTNSLSDLQNEFSRLVQATQFDGVSLLTGDFTAKKFQVGPNVSDSLSVSISDTRASAIGKVAVTVSETAYNRSVNDLTGATLTSFAASGLTINSVSIPSSAFSSDGVSYRNGDGSAIAWVNAINSYSGQTGVTAEVVATSMTWTYTNADEISSGDTLYINGVAITAAEYTVTDSGFTSLVNAINAKSTQTGVTASITTANDRISLEASDGRNIFITLDNGTFSTSRTMILGTTGTTAQDIHASSATGAAVVYRGNFKLLSDSQITIAGGNTEFAASDSDTIALTDTSTLNNLSITTASNARTGLSILNNVIRQLQNRRAEVGSKGIRFNIAEAELGVRKENLTSSESRIRDADIAVETANLTAAQILQQAGASVLARANATPQIALTLLQS